MADHIIRFIPNPKPDPLPCKLGEHITWENDSTNEEHTLDQLPACVTPQNAPVVLAPNGGTSVLYTVTKKGHFPYRHHHGHKIDGTSGTIDVS